MNNTRPPPQRGQRAENNARSKALRAAPQPVKKTPMKKGGY
tara:strand:+ start:322 stop:444 length:123 start_codon:yes stop_codon:yes gene_type:complete